VNEICFGIPGDEVEAVHARLREEGITPEHEDSWLRFDDRFGFRWDAAGAPRRVQEQRRDRRPLARRVITSSFAAFAPYRAWYSMT
ncbi:MAG TPA: hypothetical protein VFR32_02495, partial [Gaiellaceae bacterium]|nr:hypothetical protein [Gaiellaceae bacterium]